MASFSAVFPDGFEWNTAKAEQNYRKHKITFEEAATAFRDPNRLVMHDPEHSMNEDRFILIGLSQVANVLTVIHADRGKNVRIISARRATRSEMEQYGSRKEEQ